jgi:hypothetical protein
LEAICISTAGAIARLKYLPVVVGNPVIAVAFLYGAEGLVSADGKFNGVVEAAGEEDHVGQPAEMTQLALEL